MTFGNEFQKQLEMAMAETAEDKAQELIKQGRQLGSSYAKVMAEVSKLPDRHQTIFIAGIYDGLLSAAYEACPDEAENFTEFMHGLFSLSDEDLME